MAAGYTASSSITREQIAELKKQKSLVREIEAKIIAQAEEAAAKKKTLSDHRIATKQALIAGTEPPPPLAPVQAPEPEPKPEPEPAIEAAPKAAPKAKAKKTISKKSPKRTKDS
tara:strand:- start:1229 stop:1570 length:342 start_codon:yes stop_codon:yes gene_type:complete